MSWLKTMEVDLLHVKETISYTIPNFAVITVKLVHVVIGMWDEEEDKLKHYDAFLQKEDNIPEVPASIYILDRCNIKVS